MAFFPELQQRPLAQLMKEFAAASKKNGIPAEERQLWYDEAACTIAEAGEAGLSFLLDQLSHANETKRIAILLGLTCAPKRALQKLRAEIDKALVRYLSDPRPRVVAQAVDSLRLLGRKQAKKAALALREHPSPYVVGSVLRYLRQHDSDTAKPLLLRALLSPEPVIRQNAIDELDELNCVEALPQILRLTRDSDPDVRLAAETAVANLEQLQVPGERLSHRSRAERRTAPKRRST